jgi:hypothetical protein
MFVMWRDLRTQRARKVQSPLFDDKTRGALITEATMGDKSTCTLALNSRWRSSFEIRRH